MAKCWPWKPPSSLVPASARGGAVAAVGADHPGDARRLVARGRAQGDRDAVGVLGEPREPHAALDDDAELGGPVGQHGFGVGLRDVEDVGVPAGHVGGVDPEPGGAGAPVQHGEAGHAAAAGLQLGQHAQRGEHLHAARVHPHRA
jgi:hypothetical protein